MKDIVKYEAKDLSEIADHLQEMMDEHIDYANRARTQRERDKARAAGIALEDAIRIIRNTTLISD